MEKKKICAIVGGTGGYTLLRGLRDYHHLIDISAVCAMTDTGGSNRTLVYEFGMLPFSDIIQCLLALSVADEDELSDIMEFLFSYRFEQGPFKGERLGNAMYAALVDKYKSEAIAISKIQKLMLRIHGKVLPVTLEKTSLVAQYKNNESISGEHEIDMPIHEWQDKFPIINLMLSPIVEPNPEAIEAIQEADLIVVGPGDLYTSILPNIITPGVREALQKTKAKVVFPVNLMTKYGQTTTIPTVSGHIKAISKSFYLGEGIIDYCLVNTWPEDLLDDPIFQQALDIYENAGTKPVVDDEEIAGIKYIRANLASTILVTQKASDKVSRSLFRHDSVKLAAEIFKLL